MSACSQFPGDQLNSIPHIGEMDALAPAWYAVQTRAKHEKFVAQEIAKRGFQSYVPTTVEIHRWSDRRKAVEVPLFSCYSFVRFASTVEAQAEVLQVPGVLKFVRAGGRLAAIPPSEIEGVQTVLRHRIPFQRAGQLRIGQRVRIRNGALRGVEGVLVEQPGFDKIALNVHMIGDSITVHLEGYDVEPA